MNKRSEIKRREFLMSTSGAVTLAAFFQSGTSFGAENRSGAAGLQDQNLQNVMAEMEAKGGRFLSVPRKDGEFINLLIKATGAKNVLEIGTSHGYSALWIALGLEETGGELTTIEILPERVQLAKEHLGRAGLDHRVTFKEGDAHKVVPTLQGPFDFVFLDADKEGQVDYFNQLHPNKLPPGGILLAHNAIELRAMMIDYLNLVGNHPQFDTVTLSLTMEDGFSLSYRHRE